MITITMDRLEDSDTSRFSATFDRRGVKRSYSSVSHYSAWRMIRFVRQHCGRTNGNYFGWTFELNELLHCPFCGNQPQIEHAGNEHTKTRAVTVKCLYCRVSRTDRGRVLSANDLEKIAIKNWNRRYTKEREL